MRFLAFSDLHLDAPFAQGGKELADLRRAELRRTLRRITGLAADLGVDALLCAGDLYEHERFTPDTVTLLECEFRAMAPIPVLISPGNHDWYGPKSLYRAAAWSENVHIFTAGEWTAWDGLDGVRIWGFAHRAPSGTPNPFDGFQAVGEGAHLGLFHGSEDSGWSWASQRDDRKQPHAPFSAEQVRAAGFAHAVVGHCHQRVEGAVHTYGGAPTPLSFGEAGDGGAVELEFDDAGELVKRKWHTVFEFGVHGNLELDVTGCGGVGEIEDKLAELLAPLSGIARVTLVGELSPTASINIERLAARKGSLKHLSVRVGELRAGYDLDQIRGESSVRGEFVRAVEADSEMRPEMKQRVIVTGLRALDGYDDLEVV